MCLVLFFQLKLFSIAFKYVLSHILFLHCPCTITTRIEMVYSDNVKQKILHYPVAIDLATGCPFSGYKSGNWSRDHVHQSDDVLYLLIIQSGIISIFLRELVIFCLATLSIYLQDLLQKIRSNQKQ